MTLLILTNTPHDPIVLRGVRYRRRVIAGPHHLRYSYEVIGSYRLAEPPPFIPPEAYLRARKGP